MPAEACQRQEQSNHLILGYIEVKEAVHAMNWFGIREESRMKGILKAGLRRRDDADRVVV